MTSRPEPRMAHEIVEELFHLPFGTTQDAAGEWLEKQIQQAIDEARADGYVRGCNEMKCSTCYKKGRAEGYHEGQLNGLKEAKKIVEKL